MTYILKYNNIVECESDTRSECLNALIDILDELEGLGYTVELWNGTWTASKKLDMRFYHIDVREDQ